MIFDKNLFGTHRLSITTTLHKAQTETNFSVNVSHTKVEVFQGSVVSIVAHLQGCRNTKRIRTVFQQLDLFVSSVLERGGSIYLDGCIRQRPEIEKCFV